MDYQREPLSGGDVPERENGGGWVGAGQEEGEIWSEPVSEPQTEQEWQTSPELEENPGQEASGEPEGSQGQEASREPEGSPEQKASREPKGSPGQEASTEPEAACRQSQEAVSFGNNGMALASLVMGIMSLVCCCCSWLGTPCGALGIIFALLSRSDEPMSSQAKTGLILSIIGIALGVIMIFLLAGAQAFMTIWEVID